MPNVVTCNEHVDSSPGDGVRVCACVFARFERVGVQLTREMPFEMQSTQIHKTLSCCGRVYSVSPKTLTQSYFPLTSTDHTVISSTRTITSVSHMLTSGPHTLPALTSGTHLANLELAVLPGEPRRACALVPGEFGHARRVVLTRVLYAVVYLRLTHVACGQQTRGGGVRIWELETGTKVVFDLPFRPSGIPLECTKRTGFVQFWSLQIDLGHSTLHHGRAILELQWIDRLINRTQPKAQTRGPLEFEDFEAQPSRDWRAPRAQGLVEGGGRARVL